jgi:hypothetical protein
VRHPEKRIGAADALALRQKLIHFIILPDKTPRIVTFSKRHERTDTRAFRLRGELRAQPDG